MKTFLKTLIKILKWLGIVILGLIIVLLIIRCVGKLYYNRTPEGGINETMYVDINGTKQWISIYGQDKDNPVLLYLHGGPCSPSVEFDWSIFRKLSKDYTVVEWDQRGTTIMLRSSRRVTAKPEWLQEKNDIDTKICSCYNRD